jgi:hypothetical protein
MYDVSQRTRRMSVRGVFYPSILDDISVVYTTKNLEVIRELQDGLPALRHVVVLKCKRVVSKLVDTQNHMATVVRIVAMAADAQHDNLAIIIRIGLLAKDSATKLWGINLRLGQKDPGFNPHDYCELFSRAVDDDIEPLAVALYNEGKRIVSLWNARHTRHSEDLGATVAHVWIQRHERSISF